MECSTIPNANKELLVSATIGNITSVRILLHCNASDINTVDVGGRSPLIWASRYGHAEIVKLLLSHPAIDVNRVENKNGDSALTIATLKGHSKVVSLDNQQLPRK